MLFRSGKTGDAWGVAVAAEGPQGIDAERLLVTDIAGLAVYGVSVAGASELDLRRATIVGVDVLPPRVYANAVRDEEPIEAVAVDLGPGVQEATVTDSVIALFGRVPEEALDRMDAETRNRLFANIDAVRAVRGDAAHPFPEDLAVRSSLLWTDAVDGVVDVGSATADVDASGASWADPRFRSIAGGNYRLARNSPAIDAGSIQDCGQEPVCGEGDACVSDLGYFAGTDLASASCE